MASDQRNATSISPPGQAKAKVFAPRIIRLLSDLQVASEIGPSGFALIACLICRQDQLGYSRPFKAFNTQLSTALGLSDNSLRKAVNACIAAGWLRTLRTKYRGETSYVVLIPDNVPDHLLGPLRDYRKICGHDDFMTSNSAVIDSPQKPHDLKSCGHENPMTAAMTSNSAAIERHDRSHDRKICGPPILILEEDPKPTGAVVVDPSPYPDESEDKPIHVEDDLSAEDKEFAKTVFADFEKRLNCGKNSELWMIAKKVAVSDDAAQAATEAMQAVEEIKKQPNHTIRNLISFFISNYRKRFNTAKEIGSI
ncbi:hypothetical protein DTL21_06420 [Bremerella cremea]|uniref:Helix-turn-helix domain-containing protein n=1 Tax=Blastopirellula marina TaxID=124 RepID=A0A2S8FZF8_9BACT|nr:MULTISPECIES: hypothetical protein [Pirellulaceae]PQO37575.1 hypothetical protein C5Y83_06420 [Blastopirellula marina]RCS49962.1 hypothetical protein DTL21_06420 [Bremerella cremea]